MSVSEYPRARSFAKALLGRAKEGPVKREIFFPKALVTHIFRLASATDRPASHSLNPATLSRMAFR